MSYPKFKNKYLEEALIHPGHDGEEERKKLSKKLPKKCIITYQTDLFEYFLKIFKKAKKFKFKTWTWGCKAYHTKDFIFIKMKGVGAPHATVMFEEFIDLGIKEFLNIGVAGGLNKTGFYICDKSIRDEGTSYHYLPDSKYSYADKELTKKLENSFKKLKIKYIKGTNWTIDAPFRETKKEIEKYRKEGVQTVEMEISALFAVAKLRKVKIAATFFTADVLGKEWDHIYRFNPNFVINGLKKLGDVAIDCFS